MKDLDALLEVLEGVDPSEYEDLHKTAMDGTQGMLWVPNMGPQSDAYWTDADELFYGGQAGGGKTDLIIGLSLTAHERSLILRRVGKDAAKLLERYEAIIGNIDGRNASRNTWKLDNRLVELAGCEQESDKQRFKGEPHDLICFDEIGDFLESQFRFIKGWNRSATPGQRCRVVCTGNPPTTAEGLWVVQYWAPWLDARHPNPAKPGELRWFVTPGHEDVEVEGPGEYDFGEYGSLKARSRTFIPGALGDNPDLDRTDYDAVLSQLPEELRRAYRHGDFTVGLQDKAFQVIPTEWVLAAEARWEDRPPQGMAMTAMGFDPEGGGGDDGALAYHYGGWFGPIQIGKPEELKDGMSQAAFVMKHRKDEAPIGVDMGGGYGGRITDAMKNNGISVVPYVASAKSTAMALDNVHRFYNKRAEVMWRFREALDPDQEFGSAIALPPDSILRSDLTTPTWSVRNGQILIESKDDVRKRIGRSPDRGDAVMIAHATQNLGSQRFGFRGNRGPKVITGRRKR